MGAWFDPDGDVCVGVIGAGAMGRGIAQVSIQGGMRVLLFDAAPGAAAEGAAFIAGMLERAVARGRMAEDEAAAAKDRLVVVDALSDLAPAQVVIEAIVENLEIKRKVFAELEGVLAEDAIIASNTSSLRIAAIAAGCERPGRVAGLHFFNPVPLMKLVEVIRGPATADGVTETLSALGRRMTRVPVVVKDAPGFLVNLGGRAYTTESLRLQHEGVASPAQVDAVMRDCFGFRMGPFELMDLTGMDVNFPASQVIYNGYMQDRRLATWPQHESLVAAGRLGRKSGQGHYRYVDGEKVIDRDDADFTTTATPAATVSLAEDDPVLADYLQEIGVGVLSSDDGRSPIVAAPWGEDATAVAVRCDIAPERLVCIDLAGDSARRVTVMTPPGGDGKARDALAAAIIASGAAVTAIKDSPGFIAQRMVAMIANLGCEIAQIGVAVPDDVDTAMELGLNYPRGPIKLADELGVARIHATLETLQAITGEERYRPSLWLRRRALLGLSARTPD